MGSTPVGISTRCAAADPNRSTGCCQPVPPGVQDMLPDLPIATIPCLSLNPSLLSPSLLSPCLALPPPSAMTKSLDGTAVYAYTTLISVLICVPWALLAEGSTLVEGAKAAIANVGASRFYTDLFMVGMLYHLYNQVRGRERPRDRGGGGERDGQGLAG